MKTGIASAIAIGLALLLSAPAGAGQGEAIATTTTTTTLTGTLTRADYERYREVPFDVPEGATRITIHFRYGGKEQRSVVDLGLSDPQRFRGWSGGARDHMTLSAEDATPGYLPGPLPAGRWHLILGVPNIREGAEAAFEAKVSIERGPGITAFEDAPLNTAPGWYRGDLHMHSANSDAFCASQSGKRVSCPVYRTVEAAAARGLDFIALTDHNSTSHFQALRALQGAFDRMLLLPGREVTTFFGHSNVFGTTGFLDFRTISPTYAETAKWMDAVKQVGGIVSLNHAGAPSGEVCMGCGWRVDDLPAGAVQAIEVVNGGTMAETGSAESPLQGLILWRRMLDAGQHVTAIGGSDNHNADIPGDKPGAIGTPTTVVYMQNLSTQAFLEGVRSGRAFVDVVGTKDRMLDLSATDGSERAVMGGTMRPRRGATLRFTAVVQGVADGTLTFLVDGKGGVGRVRRLGTAASIPMLDWIADGKRHWIATEVRDGAGHLLLIGNPIYIEAAR